MAARLTIWRHNAAQLFFTFVTAGMVTVAAQEFFARAAPASKERWLAATLFLGTLAGISAVRIAQRRGLGRPSLRVALILTIAGLVVLLGWIVAPLLYLVLHVGLRGLINFGVQDFDAQAAALVTVDERRHNDHANTALRFLGMLAGPLVFGVGVGAWVFGGAAVLGVSVLGVWAALSLGGGAAAAKRGAALGAIEPRVRLLFAGALALYAGNFLLAASVVYIAADLWEVAGPAAHAGQMMTLVYASTVVTSLVVAGRGLRVGAAWVLPAGAALLIASGGMATAAARTTLVQAAVGALVGATFALFMLAVREVASRAQEAGQSGALAAFNNLGNGSALAAFSLMIGLVEAARALALPFVSIVSWGIGGLALVGLAASGLALARGVGRAGG